MIKYLNLVARVRRSKFQISLAKVPCTYKLVHLKVQCFFVRYTHVRMVGSPDMFKPSKLTSVHV